jgi:hypothetical protein
MCFRLPLDLLVVLDVCLFLLDVLHNNVSTRIRQNKHQAWQDLPPAIVLLLKLDLILARYINIRNRYAFGLASVKTCRLRLSGFSSLTAS